MTSEVLHRLAIKLATVLQVIVEFLPIILSQMIFAHIKTKSNAIVKNLIAVSKIELVPGSGLLHL